MRLLLVEDDPTISRFLLKGLREDQHVVDLAEDGASGLDQAGAVDYDTVVLDLMLPGLDWFEVCRQMRCQHIAAPILIISARDAVRDRVRVLDCGADDYLVKPFAFEELLARLRALARRGRNRQTSRTISYGPIAIDPSTTASPRQSYLVPDRHRVPVARVSRATRRINRHSRPAGRVRLGRGLRSVFQRGGCLRRVRSPQIARGATPSSDSHGARAWLHAEADLVCAMTWRMRRMSFRAKLTVWWTLGFGLLLAVANLAIYGAFRSYLESDLDLKVGTVAASELASSTDGLDIHLHEVPQGALRKAPTEKFVQILEADGRVRLESASLRGQPPLASPAQVRARSTGSHR